MIKQLLIIGARGFGREYYDGIVSDENYGKDFTIKGFLDDKKNALIGFEGYPPILSSVEEYQIEEGDVFTCALGNPFYRKKYVEFIQRKGGKFINLISPKSIIHPTAKIGEGVLVSPFCSISANAVIGDFSTIHVFCNIGHDVIIGKYCEIESYSFMGGFSKVGNEVTLHTRATVLPHIKIGDNAIVGAGSVVLRNVKEGNTVFGIPAKRVEY